MGHNYVVNHSIFNKLDMVEAAGVEPASETTSTESVHAFPRSFFISSSTLGTGEDAATTSLIDLACSAQTEQFRQPTVRRSDSAVGEAEAIGCLTN